MGYTYLYVFIFVWLQAPWDTKRLDGWSAIEVPDCQAASCLTCLHWFSFYEAVCWKVSPRTHLLRKWEKWQRFLCAPGLSSFTWFVASEYEKWKTYHLNTMGRGSYCISKAPGRSLIPVASPIGLFWCFDPRQTWVRRHVEPLWGQARAKPQTRLTESILGCLHCINLSSIPCNLVVQVFFVLFALVQKRRKREKTRFCQVPNSPSHLLWTSLSFTL